MGTSLPDTFASKTAAANEEYADASIGNITGSNSVNVFLGLGLPWAMAAVYWGVLFSPDKEASWRARYSEEPWYSPGMPVAFAVPAGDLGYSVGVFLICGTTTLAVLLLRRAVLGFEIGGPPHLAMLTAGFLVLLWFLYIALCVTK
jgi:Ca2+/Na+ antiporter